MSRLAIATHENLERHDDSCKQWVSWLQAIGTALVVREFPDPVQLLLSLF